jgi:hypothetical protein
LEDSNLAVVYGSAGTEVDATFPACKFGNGGYIAANGDYIRFTISNVTFNELIIETYVDTDYNVSNGDPDDGGNHSLFLTESAGATGENDLQVHGTNNRIQLGANSGGFGALALDTTSDWSTGDKVHIACVISRSASFDGAKTTAIYIDGVQTGSDASALDDRSGVTTATFNFLTNWITSVNKPFDGCGDNVMIHNGVGDLPRILANRRGERRNLNDQ